MILFFNEELVQFRFAGMPAIAHGTNGDFYADDPQCWASEENGLLRPRKEGKDR